MRFFINRGVKQGATPGRILAELCRRGKVTGGDIGSIAIHPNASTFDVRAEVSVQSEENAGRRDSRDPNTLIRRVNVGAVTLNDNGQFHFSGVSAAPSSGVRGVAASGRSGSSVEDSAL